MKIHAILESFQPWWKQSFLPTIFNLKFIRGFALGGASIGTFYVIKLLLSLLGPQKSKYIMSEGTSNPDWRTVPFWSTDTDLVALILSFLLMFVCMGFFYRILEIAIFETKVLINKSGAVGWFSFLIFFYCLNLVGIISPMAAGFSHIIVWLSMVVYYSLAFLEKFNVFPKK